MSRDMLQGTLDMLVLQIVALGPMHGWGITQRIEQISESVLRMNQGSLYPALYRWRNNAGFNPNGAPLKTIGKPSIIR